MNDNIFTFPSANNTTEQETLNGGYQYIPDFISEDENSIIAELPDQENDTIGYTMDSDDIPSFDSFLNDFSEDTTQDLSPLELESIEKNVPFVESLPLFTDKFGEMVDNRGLFVGGELINKNIVGKNYAIVQPVTVLNSFEKAVNAHDMTINNVIPNYHNGGILISAKYDNVKLLGEDHDVNLVFYTAHDGRYKTFMSLNMLRIACHNQAPALYKGRRFIINEKHYRDHFNLNEFDKILANIPDAVEKYNEQYQIMDDKLLTKDSFIEWYINFYKMNMGSQRIQNKVERLKDIYDNADGQQIITKENVRKAMNCISYINTHELSNTPYKAEAIYTKRGDDTLAAIKDLLLVA